MHHLAKTLSAHPKPEGLGPERTKDLAVSLADCALTCRACADACLAEEMVADLRHCITTDLACASTTEALAMLLVRQTAPDVGLLAAQASACEAACRACAEECEKHAEMHAHCRHCAEACRACEKLCRELAAKR